MLVYQVSETAIKNSYQKLLNSVFSSLNALFLNISLFPDITMLVTLLDSLKLSCQNEIQGCMHTLTSKV